MSMGSTAHVFIAAGHLCLVQWQLELQAGILSGRYAHVPSLSWQGHVPRKRGKHHRTGDSTTDSSAALFRPPAPGRRTRVALGRSSRLRPLVELCYTVTHQHHKQHVSVSQATPTGITAPILIAVGQPQRPAPVTLDALTHHQSSPRCLRSPPHVIMSLHTR